MSSSYSSAVTAATNTFAAELALNRIMNGQALPQSGKALNGAARALGARLDATALGYGVVTANLASAQSIVEGTQNALTELKEQVQNVYDMCLSAKDDATAQNMAAALRQNIDTLLDTEVLGVKVLDASTTPLQDRTKYLGLGPLGTDAMTVGLDFRHATQFSNFYSELTSATMTRSGLQDMCAHALKEIVAAIGEQGAQYQILSNRRTMLEDIIGIFHTASDHEGHMAPAVSTSEILNAQL